MRSNKNKNWKKLGRKLALERRRKTISGQENYNHLCVEDESYRDYKDYGRVYKCVKCEQKFWGGKHVDFTKFIKEWGKKYRRARFFHAKTREAYEYNPYGHRIKREFCYTSDNEMIVRDIIE